MHFKWCWKRNLSLPVALHFIEELCKRPAQTFHAFDLKFEPKGKRGSARTSESELVVNSSLCSCEAVDGAVNCSAGGNEKTEWKG